jgi:hypothetical protein
MQKSAGLLFVTLMLAAGSARAQGLFLEEGHGGYGTSVGAGVVKDGWAVSVIPTYTYRGVLDVGLAATRYDYTGGDAKELWAVGLQPFARAYLVSASDGELPVSLTADLGIEKRLYMGNGNTPNPDGWGAVLGGSAFRRIDFSDGFAAIPEFFLAYDLGAITWHSASADQNAAARNKGQTSEYTHGARAILRFNMAVRSDKTTYTVVPYAGYQGALAAGLNLGAMF